MPKRKLDKASSEPAEKNDSAKEKKTKKSDKEGFSSEATTKEGEPWNFKVVSWNLDGLRAWTKKGGLAIFENEDPDVICFQEIKCSDSKFPDEFSKYKKEYHSYIFSAKKEGYAGVALYSKVKPLSVQKGIGHSLHDDEGRSITAEYENFYVVTAYVPNAGRKLVTLDKRMDWDSKFQSYINKLNDKKPVIYCGDLNVSHKEIDLANPKNNKRNAGFTQEERDGFTNLLGESYVDSFRELYPDMKDQYTYWTYMMNARSKNVGWRLDYFVLSKKLLPNLCDNIIRSSVLGSDHCPISLLMHFDKE